MELLLMPDIFVETGHGINDLVTTEFKFQNASNFELTSHMFSHYKNTQTGKALIGISPHVESPIGPKDYFWYQLPNLICVWFQEIPNFKTKTFFLANHFSENITRLIDKN